MAVELPEGARQALDRLQAELKGHGLSGLRWVKPGSIHLTLKFLGDTPPGRVPAIEQALDEAARGRRPFRLSLGELRTFGGRRGPRVLWLDLEGDSELRELQRAVERALVDIGFSPEQREFSPHLTLARVPQPPRASTGERIAEAIRAVRPPRADVDVSEVVLMRSTLLPEGARYDRLAGLPLSVE